MSSEESSGGDIIAFLIGLVIIGVVGWVAIGLVIYIAQAFMHWVADLFDAFVHFIRFLAGATLTILAIVAGVAIVWNIIKALCAQEQKEVYRVVQPHYAQQNIRPSVVVPPVSVRQSTTQEEAQRRVRSEREQKVQRSRVLFKTVQELLAQAQGGARGTQLENAVIELYKRVAELAGIQLGQLNAGELEAFEQYVLEVKTNLLKVIEYLRENASARSSAQARQPFSRRNGSSAQDPYHILGISQDAPRQAVRRAYQKKMLEHHADKVQKPEEKKCAEEKMKQILWAYRTIRSQGPD